LPHFGESQKFIDEDMASSAAFQSNMAKLEENLTLISELLGQHSVPFFSPRYIGHMNSGKIEIHTRVRLRH